MSYITHPHHTCLLDFMFNMFHKICFEVSDLLAIKIISRKMYGFIRTVFRSKINITYNTISSHLLHLISKRLSKLGKKIGGKLKRFNKDLLYKYTIH